MQLGRLEIMDQARVNSIETSLKVQEIEPLSNKLNLKKEDVLKTSSVEKKQNQDEMHEVVLDHLNFGVDEKTNTFYIRVVRGEKEYQYPTEDMLKLKLHFQELRENI